MKKIALSIAGWDPSAGAGVAADLKTFAAWGLYGQGAISALTVQNTLGVSSVTCVDAAQLAATLESLAEDCTFSAIKVGMLGSAELVRTVASFLKTQPGVPVVVDPVLFSSSGAALLGEQGIEVMLEELLPSVSWVTPNRAELAGISAMAVADFDEVEEACRWLRRSLPNLTVLVTGGDEASPDDYLLEPGAVLGRWLPGQRVATTSTHGTGCTLSSSIAAIVARWPESGPAEIVRAAKIYVEGALRNAPGIGRGAGPLEHFWRPIPEAFPDL